MIVCVIHREREYTMEAVKVPLTVFTGTYYEVYHSHNWFQRDSDPKHVVVTAEYELNDDESGITLINKETVYDDKGVEVTSKEMKGVATFTELPDKKTGEVLGSLTVKFPFLDAPFQSLIADITGPNYFITKYDKSQGVFRVESPDGYLWILSAKEIKDQKEIQDIKNKFLKGVKVSLIGNMFW